MSGSAMDGPSHIKGYNIIQRLLLQKRGIKDEQQKAKESEWMKSQKAHPEKATITTGFLFPHPTTARPSVVDGG